MDHRFAISGLSKEEKAKAELEEILIQKDTGEYLIRTKGGEFISYDALSRLNSHVQTLTTRAELFGLTGAIHAANIDGKDFPVIATMGENLVALGGNLVLKDTGPFVGLISIDLDSLVVDGLEVEPAGNYPTVAVEFTLRKASVANVTFTVTKTLNELATTKIKPSDFRQVPDIDSYSVEISNITLTANPANAAKTMKYILHNILIVMN